MNTYANPHATSSHRRRSARISEGVVAEYIHTISRGQHGPDRPETRVARPPLDRPDARAVRLAARALRSSAADDGASIRRGVRRSRTPRSRARDAHSRVADAPVG